VPWRYFAGTFFRCPGRDRPTLFQDGPGPLARAGRWLQADGLLGPGLQCPPAVVRDRRLCHRVLCLDRSPVPGTVEPGVSHRGPGLLRRGAGRQGGAGRNRQPPPLARHPGDHGWRDAGSHFRRL
ncbi:Permeases of the drug/metabolite transporter (DMT) superfamily, partial [Pseudomonas sp. FEN]